MLERIKEVKERYPTDIVEISHDKDHIHILVVIPPKDVHKSSCPGFKVEYKLVVEEKISVFKESLLGYRRGFVGWLFCLNCGN